MSHESSKLSPQQISQATFNEVKMAQRMELVDADLAIELNANDGDSVIVVEKNSMVLLGNNNIIDLSLVTKVCAYADNVILKVLDENQDILHEFLLVKGVPTEIMANNVQVSCTAPFRMVLK